MQRTGYRALALCGTEYLRAVVRGRSPILEVPLRSFVVEIIIALRPHFFALSSIAALAGASAPSLGPARLVAGGAEISVRVVLAAIISGLGWGVGQLLNDLLDRETDAVNAPDRGIVAGRLPAGPALVFATSLGFALALGTLIVHPLAWMLALPAAILIVFYNAAKRVPLLGHLAHGAVMAVAAAMGAAAAIPVHDRPDAGEFVGELVASWPALLFVVAIAAWYLQANYEKDRPGDRAAGYTTLALLLSVRASAIVRGAGIVAIGLGAYAQGLLTDPVSQSTMVAGVLLGLMSTAGPIAEGSDAAALRAYRMAVPAAIVAMLALAAPLLGRWATSLVLALALALVWAAFRRSPNP
jgi:geranylgeranylglycerol-phosphate geranylgeranyltransferase